MKLLIWLALGYLCYRAVKNWILAGPPSRRHMSDGTGSDLDDVMVQDPVCGVYVSRESGIRADVNGEEQFFCSEECKNRYLDANMHR